MMNLTRRGFLGVSTVVAGLGLTACNNSEKRPTQTMTVKKMLPTPILLKPLELQKSW